MKDTYNRYECTISFKSDWPLLFFWIEDMILNVRHTHFRAGGILINCLLASPSSLDLNKINIFCYKMLWFQFDILFTYSKYCTYLSTKVLMSKLDISYFLWQKSCFNFIPQGYVIRIWFGIYLLNEWVVVFAHDSQPSMICKHWFLSLFFHF